MSIYFFSAVAVLVLILFGLLWLLASSAVRRPTEKEREELVKELGKERGEEHAQWGMGALNLGIFRAMAELERKRAERDAKVAAITRRKDNTERIRQQGEQLQSSGHSGGQLRGPVGRALSCITPNVSAGSVFNVDPRQPGKPLTPEDKDFFNASLKKEGKLECPVCKLGYLLTLAEGGCSVNLVCDYCEKKYNIVYFANQVVVGEYL